MKLNSIQFLRGIAALLVVYNHSFLLQMKYSVSWQQNFYHLKTFGCIGVDLFFVISGFIITYVSTKLVGSQSGINFLLKRFCRINPVFYIACFLCLAVYILMYWTNKIPLADSFNKTISSLIDSLLIIPTVRDINLYDPLLLVGWTLGFEWLFYSMVFIAILFNIKNKSLFLSVIILSLIATGLLLKPDDLRLKFITNPIMLEFLLGVFICNLVSKFRKIPIYVGTTCLAIGLLSYLLLIIFEFADVSYYISVIDNKVSLIRSIIWGIPSSFIVAGCIFLERNGRLNRLFNNKYVVLTGDASYSIYLLNLIIFNLLAIVYYKIGFFFPADTMIWIQVFLAVAISILFYKKIENPLIQHMSVLLNSLITTKSNQSYSFHTKEKADLPAKSSTVTKIP